MLLPLDSGRGEDWNPADSSTAGRNDQTQRNLKKGNKSIFKGFILHHFHTSKHATNSNNSRTTNLTYSPHGKVYLMFLANVKTGHKTENRTKRKPTHDLGGPRHSSGREPVTIPHCLRCLTPCGLHTLLARASRHSADAASVCTSLFVFPFASCSVFSR